MSLSFVMTLVDSFSLTVIPFCMSTLNVKTKAEKVEMMGRAQAQVGLADAEAIKAKGEAEAEVLEKKAQAFKQ